MKKKHIRLLIIVIVLFSIALIGILAATHTFPFNPKYSKYETVAIINGAPVSAGELWIFLNEINTDVYAYYSETYGITYGKDFWTTPVSGRTPLDYAIDKAIEKLAPIKIEQAMFIERGIIADAGYKNFIDEWNAENKRRASGNEMIFGPEQYTESVYYHYLHSNRINELQEMLRGDDVYIADESAMEAIYGEVKGSLVKTYGTIEIERVSVPYTGEGAVGYEDARAEIQNFLDGIGDIDDSSNSGDSSGSSNSGYSGGLSEKAFADAASRAGLTVEEEYYDEEWERGPDIRYNPELIETLLNIDEGGVSGPVDIGGAFGAIRCISKNGVAFYNFDEAREILQENYFVDAYKRTIDSLSKTADIKILDIAYKQMELALNPD